MRLLSLLARMARLPTAAALALTLAACAPASQRPPPQSQPAPTLEDLRQAARDYDAARAAGDALGMARAALARRPFDRDTPAIAPGGDTLDSRGMFAAAREQARGDAATLAAIDALERMPPPSRSPWGFVVFGRFEGEMIRNEAAPNANGGLRPRGQAAPLAIPAPPVTEIAARASLALETDVPAGSTLFVYAVTNGGTNVVLRLFDASAGTTEWVDRQPDGRLLGVWRATTATRVVVVIENSGDRTITADIRAEQTRL